VRLEPLWGALSESGRWVLGVSVALLTAAHLFLFLYVQVVFGAEAVVLGAQTRQEFLTRRFDYYPCPLRRRAFGQKC